MARGSFNDALWPTFIRRRPQASADGARRTETSPHETAQDRTGWTNRYPAVTAPGVSLILGVDLPGQHAVLATPEGWWSWGELWCPWCDFPDAVIDEAWALAWQVAA